MKISFSWLRELVAWSGGVAELAERLTLAGLPVDGFESAREDLAPIVVGEVLETRRHPNADRLTLCRVNVGDAEPLSIVCGASNVLPGIRVAVGRVGTTLPNGLTLEPRKIRGETSHGMICSGDELACDPTPDGIWVLPGDSPIGASLRAVLGLDDAVLDIDVPSNRGDCLSHFGIAREVAAWSGARVAMPDAYGAPSAEVVVPSAAASAGPSAAPIRSDAGGVAISIEDAEGCPVYGAARISGVRVGPSPAWLRARLERLGVRSLGNVVDATNLVLLECGHPTHAFDLARLRGPEVRVRRARAGERLATLDEKEQTLPPGTLAIADRDGAVAVAGISGGKDSEVNAETIDLLVEVALFDPAIVRAGARALRKTTEASLRFGRGVDGEAIPGVLERAVSLIVEVAGGRRVGAARVLRAAPASARAISFAPGDARRLLGVAIDDDAIAEILARLSCRVERGAAAGASGAAGAAAGAVAWRVTPPSYRRDLSEAVDLVEEVARLHGYDRIPEREVAVTRGAVRSDRQRIESRLRSHLAGLGFFEVRPLSLVDPGELARLRLASPSAEGGWRAGAAGGAMGGAGSGAPHGSDAPAGGEVALISVENPLSTEQSALRPSLLVGLLGCLRLNANRGIEDVKIFELGTVFVEMVGEAAGDTPASAPLERIVERRALGLVWRGARHPAAWDAPTAPADLYDLKGVIESLGDALRVSGVRAAAPDSPHPLCHPGRQAALEADGERVGFLGELDREVARAADLPEGALVAELDLERLLAHAAPPPLHRPLPRFPAIRRDVALILDEALAADRVRGAIARAAGERLESLALFDIYRGDPVPAGKKSLAYALVFRSPDGTLTDAEADALRDRVVAALAKDLGAAVR